MGVKKEEGGKLLCRIEVGEGYNRKVLAAFSSESSLASIGQAERPEAKSLHEKTSRVLLTLRFPHHFPKLCCQTHLLLLLLHFPALLPFCIQHEAPALTFKSPHNHATLPTFISVFLSYPTISIFLLHHLLPSQGALFL